MIAGIPFVLAGQLKTNTPHYIHFFLILPAFTSSPKLNKDMENNYYQL